jgi:CheY-like chemotaxis protein
MAEQPTTPQCILVIDGDVLVRHALADYLRNCGYVVVEASSTDEAITVLSDESIAIDAVLCDAEAPGSQNAFQLRAWAAEHRKHVRLALAGNIEAAAHKAAEFCDDGPHLARPYDPQAVVEYIRRLLGGAQ